MKKVRRLEQFPEYVFSRLNREIAKAEKASGRKVKNFGIGSPDVPPSETYLAKLSEFFHDKEAHLYPGYSGSPEFKDAVATWYKKRFGVDVAADEILPLLGAKDGVAHLPLALADEGDEILMPDPGYPGFAGSVLMFNMTPTYYDLKAENNFKVTAADIDAKITDKTAFVWLNFPSNPTGAVATRKELAEIVALAKRRGVYVVYDNAYSEITFDGFVAPSILEIEGAKDVAVELGSFSKTFSFAGYRMGWIVGNKAVVAALAKVKSQADSGMSLPLQRLGAYALTNQDMMWHEKMVATYKERRDVIAAKLEKLGLAFEKPKGSLYLWAKIPDSAKPARPDDTGRSGGDSETYVLDLLKEKQVFFAPGSAFGKNSDRYVRVSICVDTSDVDKYL